MPESHYHPVLAKVQTVQFEGLTVQFRPEGTLNRTVQSVLLVHFLNRQ